VRWLACIRWPTVESSNGQPAKLDAFTVKTMTNRASWVPRSAKKRVRVPIPGSSGSDFRDDADIRPETKRESMNIVVNITSTETGHDGKLADAELQCVGGDLDGLTLIGFGIWERRDGHGRTITFPARRYTVDGERRRFALLRPVGDASAHYRVRDLILKAFAQHEQEHVGTSAQWREAPEVSGTSRSSRRSPISPSGRRNL
jgi:hypothetical protein